MKKNIPHPLPLILVLIILITITILSHDVVGQNKPRNPFELFKSRPVWEDLPTNFLRLLSSKLKTFENANEFVQLCEKSGILRNNIVGTVELAGSDSEFALGSVAITLTSYANHLGGQKQFTQAKRALEFALLLNQRYLMAWASMALVTISTGDCQNAIYWADKVLSFKPDPNSKDSFERGIAMFMTPEGQKFASKGFEEKEIVDSWNEIQEQMKLIKQRCRK